MIGLLLIIFGLGVCVGGIIEYLVIWSMNKHRRKGNVNPEDPNFQKSFKKKSHCF